MTTLPSTTYSVIIPENIHAGFERLLKPFEKHIGSSINDTSAFKGLSHHRTELPQPFVSAIKGARLLRYLDPQKKKQHTWDIFDDNNFLQAWQNTQDARLKQVTLERLIANFFTEENKEETITLLTKLILPKWHEVFLLFLHQTHLYSQPEKNWLPFDREQNELIEHLLQDFSNTDESFRYFWFANMVSLLCQESSTEDILQCLDLLIKSNTGDSTKDEGLVGLIASGLSILSKGTIFDKQSPNSLNLKSANIYIKLAPEILYSCRDLLGFLTFINEQESLQVEFLVIREHVSWFFAQNPTKDEILELTNKIPLNSPLSLDIFKRTLTYLNVNSADKYCEVALWDWPEQENNIIETFDIFFNFELNHLHIANIRPCIKKNHNLFIFRQKILEQPQLHPADSYLTILELDPMNDDPNRFLETCRDFSAGEDRHINALKRYALSSFVKLKDKVTAEQWIDFLFIFSNKPQFKELAFKILQEIFGNNRIETIAHACRALAPFGHLTPSDKAFFAFDLIPYIEPFIFNAPPTTFEQYNELGTIICQWGFQESQKEPANSLLQMIKQKALDHRAAASPKSILELLQSNWVGDDFSHCQQLITDNLNTLLDLPLSERQIETLHSLADTKTKHRIVAHLRKKENSAKTNGLTRQITALQLQVNQITADNQALKKRIAELERMIAQLAARTGINPDEPN